MRKTYKSTINSYLAYLQAIYNGEINSRDLVTKYKVGTNIEHAVTIAGFADADGKSIMLKPPTKKDAEKVRVARYEYDRGMHKIRLIKSKLRYEKSIQKSAKAKPIKQRREISILWGMIKINL